MNLVRAILFSVLSLLEPLVTGLLSLLALLGLFTAGLFHWTLPPSAPRHTGAILLVSAGCALGAALYRAITRFVAPR